MRRQRGPDNPTMLLSSEKEIPRNRRCQADHFDLEIGDAVAIGVAGEDVSDEVQLAGDVMESLTADQVERLIAGTVFVRVNVLEVDHVVLPGMKVLDYIAIDATNAVGGKVEVEQVSAEFAEENVLAPVAAEHIVAGPPRMTSAPGPPMSASLPTPPKRLSLPAAPSMWSLPANRPWRR